MQLSMREAIRYAIRDEMREDPTVVVFGEDVAEAGGVFKVTAGLLEEFGPSRVRDTPISETAILGAATGAAAAGLRPVVEIMFAEFLGVSLDQLVTEAAKMHYLSAGRIQVPLVVRMSAGGGLGFGAQHSQTLESWLMNQPGLVVVSPSDAASAYGLMRSAIRDDDPLVFIEPRRLYGVKMDVDLGENGIVPLRRAAVVRGGTDVTIASLGQMTGVALEAAERLSGEASCEVVDLRTIRPWDKETLLESVSRTKRLVVVEENPFTGGWGGDLASFIAAAHHSELRGPIARITCPDVPVPFNPALEAAYLPSADDVIAAVRGLCRDGRAPEPRWNGWAAPEARQRDDSAATLARREELTTPVGRLERLYEIRAFEDRVLELFNEGLIAGSTHTCQGQEAVSVGIAAAIRPADTVTCTYRGHGVALALGMTPRSVLAEILGRSDGCLGGKGGSMHLCAPEVGLLPTFAIVGAGIPIAVGTALAHQDGGTDSVAVAVFGDGATNIGAFHESLNLAAVWRLPVVFVCENNLYGEYSRIERTTPVSDLTVRAAPYGMPAESVDGQDLDAVMAAMGRAVARARTGDGPTFVEARTYRYTGHSRGDPAKYRPAGELDQWKARDPLSLYEEVLRERGEIGEAEISAAKARARDRVNEAADAAKASPAPALGAILTDVDTSGER